MLSAHAEPLAGSIFKAMLNWSLALACIQADLIVDLSRLDGCFTAFDNCECRYEDTACRCDSDIPRQLVCLPEKEHAEDDRLQAAVSDVLHEGDIVPPLLPGRGVHVFPIVKSDQHSDLNSDDKKDLGLLELDKRRHE